MTTELNNKTYLTMRITELMQHRDELDEIIGLYVNGVIKGDAFNFEDLMNVPYECAEKLTIDYCGVEIKYLPDENCYIEYGDYITTMMDFCNQFDESGDLETDFTSALILYGIRYIAQFGRATITLD